MLDGARVAVVVPAWNEARLIATTLRSIPAFVDHIVVVDDASVDATPSRVTAIRHPRIELLRHPKNRGVGAAIATGYAHAFACGADVVAVMAADAQMDPADLAPLLRPILMAEADYVKGNRLAHPEALDAMPLFRFVGNHVLSQLTRLATGLDVHDSQCGYTAIGRRAWDTLRGQRLWPRYGYPNDLLSRAAVADLRVQDVVVRPVYADEVSGIRTHHLVFTFPTVLALGLLRRVRHRAA